MIKRLRSGRTVFGRKTLMRVGPSFVIAILAILGAASTDAATLPLEDAIRLPNQTIGFQKSVDLSLPGLTAKPGKIIVLRFKMVSFTATLRGCNYNAAIQLNGTPIGRRTSGGDERMIGRSAMFEFAHGDYRTPFPIFDGPNLNILFAPDVETGDSATKDGMGATFTLNISDIARGADVNTLTIRNIRVLSELSMPYDLIVRDIEVGWADKAILPKPPNAAIPGAASAGRVASTNATTLPLEDAIKLPDQTIGFQKSVNLGLPGLTAKPGKIIVLRFKMVSFTETLCGCNYNAAIQLNGAPIGRYIAGGDERMIGRSAMFEFAHGDYKTPFPIFDGPNLNIIFAPDVAAGDSATKDGMGATITLNISDIARGVDVNTLTIRNIRGFSELSMPYDLIVRDIEVGWADKAMLPKPPPNANAVPTRGTISAAVSAGSIRLALGNAGGFTVTRTGGPEVMVETALGMSLHAPSELLADDSLPKAGLSVTHEAFGPAGYRVTAVWPKVKLVRTVEIRGELVEWKERWTNTGGTILGIPFRHRIFLRNGDPRFILGGNPDQAALISSSMNPTLFVEPRDGGGRGWGVMMESDWLRLLSGLRYGQGIGEIYSDTMALAPQSSCDFFLTLTPVDSGGYWTFINSVRKRWGINRTGQSAPVFWGYAHVTTEKTPEDNMRKALGHLGPVIAAIGPWARSEADLNIVKAGAYSKLPPDAPRAPGACPDFDVEKWLTFQHRDVYWRQFSDECALIHNACPGVRVIEMAHPAMEAVYKPLASRWPYASEEMLTAEGKPYNDAGYNRAWLGDMVSKDWAVYYYVPRPGSVYFERLLASARRSLDDCGADGMYWDEFNWAYYVRSGSRYDYSRWDGHSADLDPQGNVIRLKCDNAWITETAQVAIVQECLLRGKFFLGNGAASLRTVNSLPIARFQEGGGGYGYMANGHLSTLPLVLANFGGRTWGDRRTRKDIFDAVKSALSLGCIYSPFDNDNLLLEGSDNFVCKLYPLTIRDLGPGTVTGEERLITTKTGSFDWPGRAASVRLYIYDEKGDLTGKDTVLKAEAGKPLALTVPKDGLVIAEIVPIDNLATP